MKRLILLFIILIVNIGYSQTTVRSGGLSSQQKSVELVTAAVDSLDISLAQFNSNTYKILRKNNGRLDLFPPSTWSSIPDETLWRIRTRAANDTIAVNALNGVVVRFDGITGSQNAAYIHGEFGEGYLEKDNDTLIFSSPDFVAYEYSAGGALPSSIDLASLQSYYEAENDTDLSDGATVTAVLDLKNSNDAIGLNNVTMNIAADGVREWEFSGTNSYINLGQQSGNNFTNTDNFTIGIQIGESNPDQAGTLFCKGGNNNGANRAFHIIKPSSGNSHWSGGWGTGTGRPIGASNADNQEQWIFLTWNGTVFQIFRNGVQQSSDIDPSETLTSVAMDLLIGGQRSASSVDNTAAITNEIFQGTIRRFATWNAVLTPSEMGAIGTELSGN